MIMSAASLGLGLGPVAGGAIVEYIGWHYLFAVTAVTILLVPMFATLLPSEKPTKGSFDALGAFFVGIGTTGLLLFLTNQSGIALAAGLISSRSVRDTHSQGAGSLRAARPVSQPPLFNAGSRRNRRLFMQFRYVVSDPANSGQPIRLECYLFRSHHFSRFFARFVPIPEGR